MTNSSLYIYYFIPSLFRYPPPSSPPPPPSSSLTSGCSTSFSSHYIVATNTRSLPGGHLFFLCLLTSPSAERVSQSWNLVRLHMPRTLLKLRNCLRNSFKGERSQDLFCIIFKTTYRHAAMASAVFILKRVFHNLFWRGGNQEWQ